ncbi:MAG: serine hydrolase domain-containing protein [Wenzhouxiangellaceae bacterium]|nr:serine hydrolase domain-containing protein [Wenzhouxiangellaceae bacterium]
MKISGMILLLCLTGGCSTLGAPVDPGTRIAELVRKLERLERRGFAGQLVVARGDEVIVRRGFGTMAPGDPRRVDAGAVMPLASVTKPITASAVLALAAEGRLALDEPIGEHLPGLAGHWAEVPVRHFLTHTAGLPAEIVNRDWAGEPRFEPIGRDTLIERVNRFRPDHPPGARFSYSNVGYNVLAALIEVVSGQSFEEFVAGGLLVTAGVDGIGLLEPGWSPERLVVSRHGSTAAGHYFGQPMLADGMGFHLRGAGDLMATPAGVIAWWRAIRREVWLSAPWMEAWLTPRVAEPDGSRYGYGWNFRDSPLGPVIGHTGQVLDFTVDLSWYPDRDLLVYINSADARFPADALRW